MNTDRQLTTQQFDLEDQIKKDLVDNKPIG